MRTARGSSRPWGVCLSACWDTPPRCGPGYLRPLGVGLDTPTPGCGPGEVPGCGPGDPRCPPQVWAWRTPLETCKACWDTTCKAYWDTTPRKPGIPSAMHAGIPPLLWTEFLTHATENITCPKLRLRAVKRSNL